MYRPLLLPADKDGIAWKIEEADRAPKRKGNI